MSGWLDDETPGIYVWRVLIGYRFRVMFQFAGTVAMWRPTRRMAWSAAIRISRDEG